MIESTLTASGRTTIPKAVRLKLNLKDGDRIRYEFDEDGVRLIALQPISRLAGCLKFDGKAKTLGDIEAGIIAGATED